MNIGAANYVVFGYSDPSMQASDLSYSITVECIGNILEIFPHIKHHKILRRTKIRFYTEIITNKG